MNEKIKGLKEKHQEAIDAYYNHNTVDSEGGELSQRTPIFSSIFEVENPNKGKVISYTKSDLDEHQRLYRNIKDIEAELVLEYKKIRESNKDE